MAELVARGTNPEDSWRKTLLPQQITLGRSSEHSHWDTPWDRQISRLHASLLWHGGKLRVRKLPEARNKIYYHGQAQDEFEVVPGEQFVIGQTTFVVEATQPDLPTPVSELTCSPDELKEVVYGDAAERIEVLSDLPSVIRHSPRDEELERRVVDVLLRGISRAEWAAVVRLGRDAVGSDTDVEVRAARNRQGDEKNLQPSRRLVYDVIVRRRQATAHIWPLGGNRSVSGVTRDPSADWALCVPLADDPSLGWGLYVAGRSEPTLAAGDTMVLRRLLMGDLKFAELAAEIFAALRQVLHLQRRQALLSRFLSRPVLHALADTDMEEVLKPRQTEVTVLFCDLRGSCRLAEEGQGNLTDLWGRVSEALNIMATSIIDQDGVIGDFQGDAAMGFWGWPLPCEDMAERAARAALAIRRHFTHASRQPGPWADFTCGIGIATGPAIAGKLGTLEQFKVDVFGPTVNLASRLESMTKHFRVPILVDERTAEVLAQARHRNWVRCRRLARVQPHGMRMTVLVSELLPPAVEPDAMTDASLRDYEAALEAFTKGRWEDASRLLERLPADGGARKLQETMELHLQTPPTDWDGVISLTAK
jgi:adenylate cyclase